MKERTYTTVIIMNIHEHRWVPKCLRTGIADLKAFFCISEKLLRSFSVGVIETLKKVDLNGELGSEFAETGELGSIITGDDELGSIITGDEGALFMESKNGESKSRLSLTGFLLVWTLPLSEGGFHSNESRSLRLKAVVAELCLRLNLCCL